jgi:FkbM family methyltransferase
MQRMSLPSRIDRLKHAVAHWLLPVADVSRHIACTIDRNVASSFAQEGEDLVLRRLLEGRRSGFFVDVGAHHPRRFSTTYYFYELGWRGINIEPSPTVIALFNQLRRRDINVPLGVAENACELKYYVFNDPALNTFDDDLMRERETQTTYRVVGTAKIRLERLDRILDQYLPKHQTIDFMSIDVEGFDLRVLRSGDWNRYRPEFVLVEALDFSIQTAAEHPIHRFMTGIEYELVAKTMNTLFYHEVG